MGPATPRVFDSSGCLLFGSVLGNKEGFLKSCFGQLGNQTCVNSVALQILALVVLGCLLSSVLLSLSLPSSLGRGWVSSRRLFDDFDLTR